MAEKKVTFDRWAVKQRHFRYNQKNSEHEESIDYSDQSGANPKKKMKDKDFYYMVTAQDDNRAQLDRAIDVFEGFADCFDGIRRCGRIYGGGATEKGDRKVGQRVCPLGPH